MLYIQNVYINKLLYVAYVYNLTNAYHIQFSYGYRVLSILGSELD